MERRDDLPYVITFLRLSPALEADDMKASIANAFAVFVVIVVAVVVQRLTYLGARIVIV